MVQLEPNAAAGNGADEMGDTEGAANECCVKEARRAAASRADARCNASSDERRDDGSDHGSDDDAGVEIPYAAVPLADEHFEVIIRRRGNAPLGMVINEHRQAKSWHTTQFSNTQGPFACFGTDRGTEVMVSPDLTVSSVPSPPVLSWRYVLSPRPQISP